MTETEAFYKILEERALYPVFQPIVSLHDGSIFGYEALSRIALPDAGIDVERLFQISKEERCVWELEELCRKKSLDAAKGKLKKHRLFLNVDPDVLHDDKFRKGATREYLKQYGIEASQIVFEITERTSVDSEETFCSVVEHYKAQDYQIAIDDFGAAYANASRVIALKPHYIKIDMSLIRGIDSDTMKRNMVKNYAAFCKSADILVIAEGIETYGELSTLVEMGITFGQGYYLQRPDREMSAASDNLKEEILRLNQTFHDGAPKVLIWDKIADITKSYPPVPPGQKAGELYRYFKEHEKESQVTVVNENGQTVGVITHAYLSDKLGGQYGYNLNIRKCAADLMLRDFLEVEADFSIVLVSQLAMGRTQNRLYDDVIVRDNGKYIGRVSVKELLEASIAIQVGIAERKNPLTGLPGNRSIEDRVNQCIRSRRKYSIAYLDLDNFKAYNDAYGFNNGDLMIKALVACMMEECGTEEFIGHIGGDDFVMIGSGYKLEEKCRRIQKKFAKEIKSLYSKRDIARGFIDSKNRNGFSEQFPLATVSIALLTNKRSEFQNIEEFSREAASAKKKAKKMKGGGIYIV